MDLDIKENIKNLVVLRGFLTCDPLRKDYSKGFLVELSLGLALRKKDGYEIMPVKVTCFFEAAKTAERLKKDDEIQIIGKVGVNAWQEKFITRITAEKIIELNTALQFKQASSKKEEKPLSDFDVPF